MDKLRNDVLSGEASVVSDIVINTGDQELITLFSSGDTKVIQKIFSSANPKSCQRIFSVVPIQSIADLLDRVPDNNVWRFLKHARSNQLHKLSQVVSEQFLKRLLDSAPSRNLRHEVLNGLPVERRKKWQEYSRAAEAEVTSAKIHATDSNSSLIEERVRLIDELSSAVNNKEAALRNLEEEMRIKQNHLHQETVSNMLARSMSKILNWTC